MNDDEWSRRFGSCCWTEPGNGRVSQSCGKGMAVDEHGLTLRLLATGGSSSLSTESASRWAIAEIDRLSSVVKECMAQIELAHPANERLSRQARERIDELEAANAAIQAENRELASLASAACADSASVDAEIDRLEDEIATLRQQADLRTKSAGRAATAPDQQRYL